jgi:hypothetical protein
MLLIVPALVQEGPAPIPCLTCAAQTAARKEIVYGSTLSLSSRPYVLSPVPALHAKFSPSVAVPCM